MRVISHNFLPEDLKSLSRQRSAALRDIVAEMLT